MSNIVLKIFKVSLTERHVSMSSSKSCGIKKATDMKSAGMYKKVEHWVNTLHIVRTKVFIFGCMTFIVLFLTQQRDIHKPRVQLREKGVCQITIYHLGLIYQKCPRRGGERAAKNLHVPYGWPQMQFFYFVNIDIIFHALHSKKTENQFAHHFVHFKIIF